MAVSAPLFLPAVCVQVLVCMGFTLESTEGGKGIATAQVQRVSICACVGRGKVRSVGSAAQVAINKGEGVLEKSNEIIKKSERHVCA